MGERLTMSLRRSKQAKKLYVSITWEDIVSYPREVMPTNFEARRLFKESVGILHKETSEYIVLVSEFDISNNGRKYCHNDYTIIPKGSIKVFKYLS